MKITFDSPRNYLLVQRSSRDTIFITLSATEPLESKVIVNTVEITEQQLLSILESLGDLPSKISRINQRL